MKRFFRRFLAVGQKTGENGPFGQGFNYMLEVSVPGSLDREDCVKALKQVTSAFDHKALGVDVNFAEPITSVNLLKVLRQELEKKLGVEISVQLERGDGFVFKES